MAELRSPLEARLVAISTGILGKTGATGVERLRRPGAARRVEIGGLERTTPFGSPGDKDLVRRLRLGGNRPSCPRGHRGRIWISARYSRWSPYHDRVRWRCVPADGSGRHDFYASMPLRHPTERHPDGGECQFCDKGYEPWEGPRVGHKFTFSVQEIADVLLSVGQGNALRETAWVLRHGAYRPRTFTRKHAFTRGTISREARTVTAYLDAFAPVILDAHTSVEWPEAVAIDSLPLRRRGMRRGEVVSLNAGEVMAAVDHAARPSRPILARVRGGKDAESWLDVLVSKTGQPRWVVADGGPEIEYAVGQAWPDAILYRCDEHLRRNARKWALEDGIGKWRKTAGAPPDMVMVKEEESEADTWPPKRHRYFELHPVYAAILTCLGSPAQWAHLKAVVEAEVPESKVGLRNWIADNEALVLQQCQMRQRHPGMPISTGQAEAFLETNELDQFESEVVAPVLLPEELTEVGF